MAAVVVAAAELAAGMVGEVDITFALLSAALSLSPSFDHNFQTSNLTSSTQVSYLLTSFSSKALN